jgi:hypothetical protein
MALHNAASFRSPNTEFDVSSDDLTDLEIRNSDKHHYFYDRKRKHGRALVKYFILADRRRTVIRCTVTLVKREDDATALCSVRRQTRARGL